MEKEENAKVVIQISHQNKCIKMNDDEITDEIDRKYKCKTNANGKTNTYNFFCIYFSIKSIGNISY